MISYIISNLLKRDYLINFIVYFLDDEVEEQPSKTKRFNEIRKKAHDIGYNNRHDELKINLPFELIPEDIDNEEQEKYEELIEEGYQSGYDEAETEMQGGKKKKKHLKRKLIFLFFKDLLID